MNINGQDIGAFGAKQWRVEIGNSNLANDSEWIRGSPLPFLQKNAVGLKEIYITLMVYGTSREEIRNRISDITACLMNPAEIELDGFGHKFCCILEKASTTEHTQQSRRRFQAVQLQMSGYEYSEPDTVASSGTSRITVDNPGNIVSPAIITLTPTFGAASVTLSGICRDSETGEDLPVTIRNLTTGKKIILDGTSGLITEDGTLKAGDVDMWALPTLVPGANVINFSTDNIKAEIKIMALYL